MGHRRAGVFRELDETCAQEDWNELAGNTQKMHGKRSAELSGQLRIGSAPRGIGSALFLYDKHPHVPLLRKDTQRAEFLRLRKGVGGIRPRV